MSTCVVDKFKLWSLLEEDSLGISEWLISDNAEAKSCKYIFDTVTYIDLSNNIILNNVLPYLENKNLISYRSIKRITDYIQNNKREIL